MRGKQGQRAQFSLCALRSAPELPQSSAEPSCQPHGGEVEIWWLKVCCECRNRSRRRRCVRSADGKPWSERQRAGGSQSRFSRRQHTVHVIPAPLGHLACKMHELSYQEEESGSPVCPLQAPCSLA